jgi:hypothetical protein
MDGLEIVARTFAWAGVVGELWIDGSFATEKENPRDADVLLHVDASLYDHGSPGVRAAVDWAISNLKALHHCDSYVWLEYPQGHALYWTSEWDRAYWIKQFGFSRVDDYKGIIVLPLPSGIT